MSMRTKFLIYPKFQISLIIGNLAVMSCMIGAVVVAIYRSYHYLHEQGVAVGLSADHPYFRFVELQSRLVYQALALAFGVGAVVSVVVTLILSQRLAGPIHRLREYFRDIANGGAVQPLGFRKRDFFSDLPEVINQALGRLRK